MALTPVFKILNNVPVSDAGIMTNIRGYNGNGLPSFQGKKTQVGSDFTVTAYATAVPASNTGYLLSAVGIGTAATVGNQVINAAGTRTAWVLEVISANQVRVSTVTNSDLTAFTYAGGNFTAAETVRLYTVPSIPSWPFGSDVMYPGCQDLEIQGELAGTGTFDQAVLGSSLPAVFRCRINGWKSSGGGEGVFGGCLFTSHASVISANACVFAGCALDRTSLTVADGVPLAIEVGFDVSGAGSKLFIIQSGKVIGTSGVKVGVFNTNQIAIDNQLGGRFQLPSAATGCALYGSGNSNYIYSGGDMTEARLPKTNCTATTSAATPLNVGGVDKNYADIEYVDSLNQAFVIQ